LTQNPIDPYWFQGTVLSPGDYELHHFYIYHLPKTGATTVYSSLRSSFETHFKILQNGIPNYIPPHIERIDDARALEVERFPLTSALIASHHPYGFHKKFTQSFKLITVLRDPYRRVLSSYTYDCMRRGVLPNTEGFIAFFRSEENRNMMTKQLSGLARPNVASSKDLQKAIDHLKQEFFIYGTTQHISKIISTLLKMNKMPNIICDHLNKTEDKYLMDGKEFEQEIRELNAIDQELFAFVEGNPRVDIDLGDSDLPLPPHQLTVLIKEVENATDGAKAEVKVFETDGLFQDVKDGHYPTNLFNRFFMDNG